MKIEKKFAEKIDLSRSQKIHIAGLGGAGMSSIAVVLLEMGHRVSGSDMVDSDLLQRLNKTGIATFIGHREENLSDADIVAHSSAVLQSNPELKLAHSKGIQVFSRAEILSAICRLKKTVAVAGSHGKTTTSAMLAAGLKNASYLIGGELNETGVGGHWNEKGEWLIVEADESDATFLKIPKQGAIITSMDPDHIEQYGSKKAHQNSYLEFADSVDGWIVCNMQEPALFELCQQLENAISYGIEGNAESGIESIGLSGKKSVGKPDFWIRDIKSAPEGSSGTLVPDSEYGHNLGSEKNSEDAVSLLSEGLSSKGPSLSKGLLTKGMNLSAKKMKIELPIPGAHNVSNAAAAILAGVQMGADPYKMLKALKAYRGVARRFEILGKAGGITFIDDYAHLPEEISKTLETVSGWGRVVCAFQPHRYSRVQTLWRDYSDAFNECDLLAVSEIYPAGELERPGVSAKLILNAVLEANPRKKAAWIPKPLDLGNYLLSQLRPGDIFITLNAGDLHLVGKKIYETLSDKNTASKRALSF